MELKRPVLASRLSTKGGVIPYIVCILYMVRDYFLMCVCVSVHESECVCAWACECMSIRARVCVCVILTSHCYECDINKGMCDIWEK